MNFRKLCTIVWQSGDQRYSITQVEERYYVMRGIAQNGELVGSRLSWDAAARMAEDDAEEQQAQSAPTAA